MQGTHLQYNQQKCTFHIPHAPYFHHKAINQGRPAGKPKPSIKPGSRLEVLVLKLAVFWLTKLDKQRLSSWAVSMTLH